MRRLDFAKKYVIMISKMNNYNIKIGKRLAKDQVVKLRRVIELLLDVVGYVDYYDEVEELFYDLDLGAKATVRETIDRLRATTERKPTGGSGGANWGARAGETIIGDLARGEGGRFVSAVNVKKMSGMLDRANISPDMVAGIQSLFNNGEVDSQTLLQMENAGLVTDAGVLTQKATEVLKAVQSGNPDNLKAVVKPTKPKSAKGRGKKPPKPTKEEIQAQNLLDMKDEIVNNDRMSEEQYDAMIEFANGEDVDKMMLEELDELGLTEIDADGFYRFTSNGDRVLSSLQRGELRDALDRLSKAKSDKVKQEQEEIKNLESTSAALVKDFYLTEDQKNDLLNFVENLEVQNPAGLIELGVAEEVDGELSFTEVGNQVVKLMQEGDIDVVKDLLPDPPEMSEEEEQAQNVANVKSAILDNNPEIAEEVLDALLQFSEGEALGDLEQEALTLLGLLEGEGDGVVQTSFSKRLVKAMKNGNIRDALDEITKAKAEKSFMGFKVLQGKSDDYLLTWTTNSYVDREGEAFKLESLEEFVKECDERDDKGVYQFWHVPGSDFADVVALTVSGKFLVEIGRFRKDKVGQAFKKFFLKYPDGHPAIAPMGWGCSHGFVYKASDREDKVYEWFDKKETTILPIEQAANIFTLMEMLS